MTAGCTGSFWDVEGGWGLVFKNVNVKGDSGMLLGYLEVREAPDGISPGLGRDAHLRPSRGQDVQRIMRTRSLSHIPPPPLLPAAFLAERGTIAPGGREGTLRAA